MESLLFEYFQKFCLFSEVFLPLVFVCFVGLKFQEPGRGGRWPGVLVCFVSHPNTYWRWQALGWSPWNGNGKNCPSGMKITCFERLKSHQECFQDGFLNRGCAFCFFRDWTLQKQTCVGPDHDRFFALMYRNRSMRSIYLGTWCCFPRLGLFTGQCRRNRKRSVTISHGRLLFVGGNQIGSLWTK